MKRVMNELRIIAKRTDGVYIVAINDTDGFVVSEQGKVISPIMMYDAFIKFGYWDEYNDDNSGFELEKFYNDALRIAREVLLFLARFADILCY